jgi:uncharacterized membrane protein YfcA
MFFPISHTDINPIYLAVVGFVIGILGGFFGVGGSFIAGPALRLMGVDWNYAVGTDLAHIVGKSIVAARQHRTLGNVDLKLGLIMALGTIGGAEAGAQLIVHPHLLRHSCGYALANKGCATRLIQDYLGHRNIRHTQLYTCTAAVRFEGLWR